MFDSLLAVEGGVALNADFVRIFRIAEKIARGLQALYGSAAFAPVTAFETSFREFDDAALGRSIGEAFSCEPITGEKNGWKFSIHSSVLFEVCCVRKA